LGSRGKKRKTMDVRRTSGKGMVKGEVHYVKEGQKKRGSKTAERDRSG